MRQCPTLSGDDRPLIAHSIQSDLCMQRQREFYHKCHRCMFRGQAADFAPPLTNGTSRPSLNVQPKLEQTVTKVHSQNGTAKPTSNGVTHDDVETANPPEAASGPG
jgi:hypothetical protein